MHAGSLPAEIRGRATLDRPGIKHSRCSLGRTHESGDTSRLRRPTWRPARQAKAGDDREPGSDQLHDDPRGSAPLVRETQPTQHPYMHRSWPCHAVYKQLVMRPKVTQISPRQPSTQSPAASAGGHTRADVAGRQDRGPGGSSTASRGRPRVTCSCRPRRRRTDRRTRLASRSPAGASTACR